MEGADRRDRHPGARWAVSARPEIDGDPGLTFEAGSEAVIAVDETTRQSIFGACSEWTAPFVAVGEGQTTLDLVLPGGGAMDRLPVRVGRAVRIALRDELFSRTFEDEIMLSVDGEAQVRIIGRDADGAELHGGFDQTFEVDDHSVISLRREVIAPRERRVDGAHAVIRGIAPGATHLTVRVAGFGAEIPVAVR